ncbi:MAG: HNH endonuclease [Acidobacteriota bacterium]
MTVLNSNVLVLNNLYQALQITSVRRAMCLFYKGHVKAVDIDFATYDFHTWSDLPVGPGDDAVATPSRRIRIPRVVLLVGYDRLPRYDVRFTRRNIFYRDRNRCQYCGHRFRRVDLNLDHVIPLSRGGRSTWDNVVCCCIPCNMRKGNRLPAEARMRLTREPGKPRWHPLARIRVASRRYEIWRRFLDAAYWNVELDQDDLGDEAERPR